MTIRRADKKSQNQRLMDKLHHLNSAPRIVALCNGDIGCTTEYAIAYKCAGIKAITDNAKDYKRLNKRFPTLTVRKRRWLDTSLDGFNMRFFDGMRTWPKVYADIMHTLTNITEPTIIGLTFNKRFNRWCDYGDHLTINHQTKLYWNNKVIELVRAHGLKFLTKLDTSLYKTMYHTQFVIAP